MGVVLRGTPQVSDDTDMHQLLGQHAARLDEIDRWRAAHEGRINARFDAQDAQLVAIRKTLDQLAGGWKLILIIGAGLALISDGALRLYRMLIPH